MTRMVELSRCNRLLTIPYLQPEQNAVHNSKTVGVEGNFFNSRAYYSAFMLFRRVLFEI